jgi:hypothetical protein
MHTGSYHADNLTSFLIQYRTATHSSGAGNADLENTRLSGIRRWNYGTHYATLKGRLDEASIGLRMQEHVRPIRKAANNNRITYSHLRRITPACGWNFVGMGFCAFCGYKQGREIDLKIDIVAPRVNVANRAKRSFTLVRN